jgi:dienelactone hydrolase
MREQHIEYRDGETLLEGFLCYDEALPGPRPAVLICHAWRGRDDFVERKARRLAWQGYACFVLDNFGKGKRGTTPEECAALIEPFMKDRRVLLKRLQSGLSTARALPIIDSQRIAIMGFCFGGLCALDLARSNADIRGAVSFHGMLNPSGFTEPKVRAKVLMLHGYDDPLAPPEDVLAVAREFTDTRRMRSPIPWPKIAAAACNMTRVQIVARGTRSRNSSAKLSSSQTKNRRYIASRESVAKDFPGEWSE